MLVNDLKALGEEVKDKDFSHKFLRCLPSRFGTLVTILVRSGLDTVDVSNKHRQVNLYLCALGPDGALKDTRFILVQAIGALRPI